MLMNDKIQFIKLELRDGRTVVFSGPVQLEEEDNLRVCGIETWTQDLPEDCRITTLEDLGIVYESSED
jgi:hypothetical protein